VCFVAALAGVFAFSGCEPSSPPAASVPETTPQAGGDPGATLTQILNDPDPFARARALGAVLPTLGPEAIPEVKKLLRDPAFERGAAEYELMVEWWARHEPADATRWAADWSPIFYRQAALSATLPHWVAADLQASLVAVRGWMPYRPDLREAAPRALVMGWYEAGHPGLLEYIHDLGAGLDQQTALSTYLRVAIPKEGGDAVMRWAESVPEEDKEFKLAVYRQVASILPLYDHAAAIRWCEAQCDGPYGLNLRQMLAMRWALKDGPAALVWLSGAPEGHEKNLGIRATFREWMRQDPDGILVWMDEQTRGGEPPAWLEPVYPLYSMLLAERSPADAIPWAQRIEKDLEREITLVKIARKWRARDEAAAEAWLAASPLSEEARAEVRDPNWRRPGSPTKNKAKEFATGS
jgi:hypothetical protein